MLINTLLNFGRRRDQSPRIRQLEAECERLKEEVRTVQQHLEEEQARSAQMNVNVTAQQTSRDSALAQWRSEVHAHALTKEALDACLTHNERLRAEVKEMDGKLAEALAEIARQKAIITHRKQPPKPGAPA